MKKILVVDDDNGCREACKEALRVRDYIIVTADNSEDALQKLDETFNLVLTDLKMPGHDGIWLAKKIKEKFLGKIPVVIMSGALKEISYKDIKDSGISDTLPKPFGAYDLISIAAINLRNNEIKRQDV